VGRVSFPALARDSEHRAKRAAKIMALTAIAAGLPLALVAGTAQPLIGVLLGDEWLPTTDIVLIGSLGMLITSSALATMMSYALAEADANPTIAATGVEALLQCAIAVTLTGLLHEIAVGIAITVGSAASMLVLAATTAPGVRSALFRVGRTALIAVAAAGAGQALDLSHDVTGLAVGFVTVSAVWVTLETLFARRELGELLGLARPVLRRMRSA